jgi:hypothetical protein
MATTQKPPHCSKTIAVMIAPKLRAATLPTPKKIHVDIEPMPAAALQTYIAGASDPGALIEHAQGGRQAGGVLVSDEHRF